jgi:hypothetical protein
MGTQNPEELLQGDRRYSFCSEPVFRMHNHKAVPKNTGTGQVTLGHLLLAIAFFQPVGVAVIQIQHSGGGILRYLIVAPVALVLGFLIASLDWKLGKAVWLRCQQYSSRAQKRVAIALFCLQLLWIVLGTMLGFKLATFVAAHRAR